MGGGVGRGGLPAVSSSIAGFRPKASAITEIIPMLRPEREREREREREHVQPGR